MAGAQEQESEASSAPSARQPLLQAVINGPEDIAVGRTIVLDGSFSRAEGEIERYRWFLEGRVPPISDTVEAVYTPDKPGLLTFRLVLTVALETGERTTAEALYTVTVYRRKVAIIADGSVEEEALAAQRQAAADAGVFLRVLRTTEPALPLGAEDALAALLAEQTSALEGADTVVLWTDGVSGLQAFTRALTEDAARVAGLHNQTVVLLTERALGTVARIARGSFARWNPQQILVTQSEALAPLLAAEDTGQFLGMLGERNIPFERVDVESAAVRWWNPLSLLVNAMLTRGVPSQTVILLLVLPVIAMILAFLKQVVGITTFGLYTPSVIALSFLALGWEVGVTFLLFIVATGYATRAFMRRWRLLYIPKVAVVITAVSITLLLLMGISASFDVTFSRETVFILLIMSTLAESFLNLKTEQGWTSAILGIAETVLAALLCVFIVQWSAFQTFVLAYPEAILLTVFADVLLGRWTGLRLVEYFRFREVFKHLQEE